MAQRFSFGFPFKITPKRLRHTVNVGLQSEPLPNKSYRLPPAYSKHMSSRKPQADSWTPATGYGVDEPKISQG